MNTLTIVGSFHCSSRVTSFLHLVIRVVILVLANVQDFNGQHRLVPIHRSPDEPILSERQLRMFHGRHRLEKSLHLSLAFSKRFWRVLAVMFCNGLVAGLL